MDQPNTQRWIWIPNKVNPSSPAATSTLTYAEMYKQNTIVQSLTAQPITDKTIIPNAGTLYRAEVPRRTLMQSYMWVITLSDNSKTLYEIVSDNDIFPTIQTYNQHIYTPMSISNSDDEKQRMAIIADYRNNTTHIRFGPYMIDGKLHYLQATRIPVSNPISTSFPLGLGVEGLDTTDI